MQIFRYNPCITKNPAFAGFCNLNTYLHLEADIPIGL
jgi:hypothetical protein